MCLWIKEETKTNFYIMDTVKNSFYESPEVEIIEVQVEKGFATSNGTLESIGDGGTI